MKRKSLLVGLAATAILALASPAWTQTASAPSPSNAAPMSSSKPDAAMPAFAKEDMEAMDKMRGPMMAATKAPDADEAFVRGMIPHHQGAIDMAQIVLKYGKDDQVKAWANDVIRAQSKEKAEFEAWLKKHPK